MNNKQSLLNLVARAERGVLLPGEAQILRDAIELLDDMAMCLDKITSLGTATAPAHPDYEASTTQTFRAVTPTEEWGFVRGPSPDRVIIDDDAPGRP